MRAPLTSPRRSGSMSRVKALRYILWLAWFLVAFLASLVLFQYGPARFQQGAGDLVAEAKGLLGGGR
jgi:hypothetical protein